MLGSGELGKKFIIPTILLTALAAMVWATSSFLGTAVGNAASIDSDDSEVVGLMIIHLDSSHGYRVTDDIAKNEINEGLLAKLPSLLSLIEEAREFDKLGGNKAGPYQKTITKIEAETFMKTLPMKHTNSADNYDSEGNKIGKVNIYGSAVEVEGKLYGVILVFPK